MNIQIAENGTPDLVVAREISLAESYGNLQQQLDCGVEIFMYET